MEELAKSLVSCEFATPFYFGIACALVLLLIFFPRTGKKRGLAIDLQFWEKRVAFKSGRVWVLSLPVIIASVLMAGVLASPQVTMRPITYIYGYPVMLVLDVSGSMGVGYTQETSFSEASNAFYYMTSIDVSESKNIAAFKGLVTQRSELNFGLLIFSSENYIARYFINKIELFKDTLENSKEIAYISKGTQIPEALAKACQFLTSNVKGKDKAIILVSDLDVPAGILDAPSSEESRIIKEINRISVAGINTYIICTIPGRKISGLNIINANDKDGIDRIFEEISAMQMSPIREEEGSVQKSLIPFLILPTVGVVILCLILGETRFQKIP